MTKTRLLRIECEGHAVEVRIVDEHFNVETIEGLLRQVSARLVKLVANGKPADEGEKHERS